MEDPPLIFLLGGNMKYLFKVRRKMFHLVNVIFFGGLILLGYIIGKGVIDVEKITSILQGI